jgi:hypothetical protein
VPKPPPVPEHKNRPATDERKQHDRGVSGASLESVAPKRRRNYVASERLRLLKAADAAVASGERGALQAMLRREGIYSSHLTKWRQQFAAKGAAGLKSQKPGRKPKLDDKARQLLALTKRNAGVGAQAAHRGRAHRTSKKSTRNTGYRSSRERRGQLMALVEERDAELVPEPLRATP